MKGIRQWVFVTTLVFCLAGKGWGQTYNGMHKYDGTHQNMVTGYMMLGDNIICDTFYGLEASYTRHLTDRWHVGADSHLDRLIFLDSASGTLGEEQIDEIESHFFDIDIQNSSRIKIRHTFIFGHTNIFRPSATEFASTFTREETYYLLNKFDQWNASIVFSGHVHAWDERKVGNITYLTLDAMSEENNPGPGDYLVRVHVERDGSLSWKRIRMNYTPSLISQ